jgi:L-rhamnose isomerase / sugar isomerase
MASKQEAKEVLKRFWIETPSWAYGNSGTRFKVFAQPGVPRDPYEKIADAAQVHKFTGAAPSVAMHIPWDKTDDYAKLAKHAKELGVRLGTVNSNTFQDDDYKYGSVCHFDKKIRQKAVDHLFECIEIMNITGAQDLKLWFADGTNYPGQDDLAGRQDRLFESLQKVYARLSDNQRMLLSTNSLNQHFIQQMCQIGAPHTCIAQSLDQKHLYVLIPDTTHQEPTLNTSLPSYFVKSA